MGRDKIWNSFSRACSPSRTGLNWAHNCGWAVHIGPLNQKIRSIFVYTRYTLCGPETSHVFFAHTSATGLLKGTRWATHYECRANWGMQMPLDPGPGPNQFITMWITIHIVITSGTVSGPFSWVNLAWAGYSFAVATQQGRNTSRKGRWDVRHTGPGPGP